MSQNDRNDQGTFERTGERIGEAAGRMVGRGTDMAAGMIGSILGSAMNTLGDWWSSADAKRAADSFDQKRDRSCREHFESSGMSIDRDYDQVRPLYQFGHMAGQDPAFAGQEFGEVEPDLQRAWEGQQQDEHRSEWPEVRGYVGFGFEQRDESDQSGMR